MQKRRVELCAFCRNETIVTREHFVPKGLWAECRPRFTLTMPTCEDCNAGCSDDDEYFRNAIVIGASDYHPVARKVFQKKVLPSLRSRHVWRREICGTMKKRVPRFTPSGLWFGTGACFEVDKNIMDRVACKIVLGLFYTARRYPLPKSHSVHIGSGWNKLTAEIAAGMSPHMSPEIGFGDDVFLWRFVGWRDDPATTYWHLAFYRNLLILGATLPDQSSPAIDRIETSRLAG